MLVEKGMNSDMECANCLVQQWHLPLHMPGVLMVQPCLPQLCSAECNNLGELFIGASWLLTWLLMVQLDSIICGEPELSLLLEGGNMTLTNSWLRLTSRFLYVNTNLCV